MKRVYFIKPIGFDGPIKIGCSYAPVRRMEQLRLWSPFPLEILATIEGNGALERRFHAKFLADHQSREWFYATEELLADIEAINAGTFNIDTLPEGVSLAKVRTKRAPAPWSDERRAHHGRQVAVRRAEKVLGCRFEGSWEPERIAAFVAEADAILPARKPTRKSQTVTQ